MSYIAVFRHRTPEAQMFAATLPLRSPEASSPRIRAHQFGFILFQ